MSEWAKEIPSYAKEGIDAYVENRIPPGGFLYAVLTNNLREAIERADFINSRNLREIVGYCVCDIPAICWGSEEKVNRWLAQRERINREQTSEAD